MLLGYEPSINQLQLQIRKISYYFKTDSTKLYSHRNSKAKVSSFKMMLDIPV